MLKATTMAWLVLGGSGQLGSDLVSCLQQVGTPVLYPTSRELDILTPQAIKEFVELTKPLVVVNCAAFTDVDMAESNPEAARSLNATGASNLAEAVERLSTSHLIQVSTDYVFSGRHSSLQPWSEEDRPAPLNEYGLSKLEGEDLVRSILPSRSVVVRTSWLYSPGRRNFVSSMVDFALEARPAFVVDDQWGQPSWARDVARCVASAGKGLVRGSVTPGVYHATNAGATTRFRFAQYIYGRIGADPDLVSPISSDELARPARRPHWSVLGHDGWRDSGVAPMRHWEEAANEALPLFLQARK